MLISPLLALLAASSTLAQDQNGSSNSGSGSFLSDLVQTLNSSGLDRLATFVQNVSETSIGQQVLRDLFNGNKTIFAPVDRAFNGKPPSNITDRDLLAAIFSYHVVPGSFDTDFFANTPDHTLVRTYMNSSQVVSLEGGRPQMLSLSNINGTIHFLNQNTPVQIINSTAFNDTRIHVINAVLDPPAPVDDVLNSKNLSQLVGAATVAGLVSPIRDAHGITIFAPTNDAFANALQNMDGGNGQNITADPSIITTVLKNHIINGTSVYAGEFTSGKWTSAAGQSFQFATNTSGIFVTSGNDTARVVESDLLTKNGVVHVIDNVFLNLQSDPSAASSAFQSATSEAASNPTPTSPIKSTGFSGNNDGNGSQTGNGNSSGNGSGGNGGNGNGNGNGSGNGNNGGAALPLRPLFVSLLLSFLAAVSLL